MVPSGERTPLRPDYSAHSEPHSPSHPPRANYPIVEQVSFVTLFRFSTPFDWLCTAIACICAAGVVSVSLNTPHPHSHH